MSDISPIIALATPADLPEILNMIQDLSAFHGDKAAITPDQLNDIFFGPAPMGTALIAKSGEIVLGYAGLTPTMVLHEAKVRLDIHHLFVVDGYRAQGIGTALINAAKDFAIQTGATRLTIGTDPGNDTAITAYRAMALLEEITGAGPRFRVDLAL